MCCLRAINRAVYSSTTLHVCRQLLVRSCTINRSAIRRNPPLLIKTHPRQQVISKHQTRRHLADSALSRALESSSAHRLHLMWACRWRFRRDQRPQRKRIFTFFAPFLCSTCGVPAVTEPRVLLACLPQNRALAAVRAVSVGGFALRGEQDTVYDHVEPGGAAGRDCQ